MVSVLIVTYRSGADIERCLRSVRRHTSVAHELIVVDNNSDDNTVEVIKTHFPEVTLIESDTNLGFAGGMNRAAASATAGRLLLLNPDTELRPGCIDELVNFADGHSAHQIYGGRAVHSDGSVDPMSVWGLPSLWSWFCFATGLQTAFAGSARFDPESLGSWPRDTVQEVGAVSGALLLIDRSLWDDLNGLDEAYFMYAEDIDLAIRARALGSSPVLVPTAELIHDLGSSSSSENQRVMILRGKATLAKRHWSAISARIGVQLLVAGTALRGPVANTVRKLRRRPADSSWAAAWARRGEWRGGW